MKKILLITLLIVSVVNVKQLRAQNYYIFNEAGNGHAGYNGDGEEATSSYLYVPEGVAVDDSGNVYIGDTRNNRVRKVNTDGIISTIAGTGTAGASGDGGPATSAEIRNPFGIFINKLRNLYITDAGSGRIRMVSKGGIISTIAGTVPGNYNGDGMAATDAVLDYPQGIAVDSFGNVYIADDYGNRIRKVDTNGIIHTIAGNGTGAYSGDGAAATAAEINGPTDVALDDSGNIYIADNGNNRIRKISTNGIISTLGGNGIGGYSGDGMQATSAELNGPVGVQVDDLGNIYVGDALNDLVRKINSSGIITSIAGGGTSLGTDSLGDGIPADSTIVISEPCRIAIDLVGNLYIADVGEDHIRKLIPTPNFTVWPGDANNDLTVNNFDLLPIGLYYGQTGYARDTTTNTWVGHACLAWDSSQANGMNRKYVDCNGDGTINANDTMAVSLNYGLSHQYDSPPKHLPETGAGTIPLYFIPDYNSYQAGNLVHVAVWLGNSGNTVSAIYGLAYDIVLNTSVIQAGTLSFSYNNSFVGTKNTNAITLTHYNNDVETAVTGTDHANKTGYGKIGDLYFTLDTSSAAYNLVLSVSTYEAVDDRGNQLLLAPTSDTLSVTETTTGISQSSVNNNQISIYPNPTSGVINIISSTNMDDIKVTNLLGQTMLKSPLGDLGVKQTFDVRQLPDGMYFVTVTAGNQSEIEKVVIGK